MPKIKVEIEWDKPANRFWLNADNVALALHAYCLNTRFKVTPIHPKNRGRVKTIAAALLLLAFLVPQAHAWRTGVGMKAGLIEGEPATALHLELDRPGSHVHLQPRLQVWKPGDQPGRWEIGLDAIWHSRPCHSISPYAGGGLGAEWLPAEPAPITGSGGGATHPQPPPKPPKPDPPQPIAVVIAGVRFPGKVVDCFIEGRATFSNEAPRGGPFVGVTFHEPRRIKR